MYNIKCMEYRNLSTATFRSWDVEPWAAWRRTHSKSVTRWDL